MKILLLFTMSLANLTWNSSEGPLGREHAALFSLQGKVYLAGGHAYFPVYGTPMTDLWELSEGKWKEIPVMGTPPHPTGRGTVVGENYIFFSDKPVFFGQRTLVVAHMLSIKDGIGRWSMVPILGDVPESMQLSHLFYDEKSAKLYTTCTVKDCELRSYTVQENGTLLAEKIETEGTPTARFGFSAAFDQESRKLVLVSGQVVEDNSFSQELLALDLETKKWTPAPGIETGRRNPVFGHDPINRKLVIWGGTFDGRTSVQEVLSVNLADLKVENLPLPDAPARSSGMGVFDPKSQKLLMGFGNGLTPEGQLDIHQDLVSF